jgi:hypothetical protein
VSFPRFKRKGHSESFRYPDAKQFEIDEANSRLFLPKLGWVRYRNSRAIQGEANNITVRAMAHSTQRSTASKSTKFGCAGSSGR